jgi:hypothetical protein
MLIQITPTFFCCDKSGWDCDLIDLTISEIGLKLESGKDLLARRPWPNKNYLVVSAKASRRALVGLLIEAPGQIQAFTAITRWSVNAEYVLEHVVNYVIPDQEFDAATDQMVLWYGERMSGHHTGSPMSAKPVAGLSLSWERERKTEDEYNVKGQLVRIADRFVMPTITRSSIDPSLPALDRQRHIWDRHPPMSSIFRI